MDGSSTLAGWIILAIIAFLYFVPTIVASNRKHHNTMAIFVLNLFLGWTFIGWLAALVWACTATYNSRTEITR